VKSVYLCHPLSDDPIRNQLNASRWGVWIAQTFGCAVSADWIWLSQVLDESPANRKMGLANDFEAISRQDELWTVGGKISSGMVLESAHASSLGRPLRDLTYCGGRSPRGWSAQR